MGKILAFLICFAQICYGQSATSLNATYSIDSSWPAGYQVTVTLNNPTNQPTSNWSCTFSLPANQTISSLWNGVVQEIGQNYIVVNPTWIGGGVIPAFSSTTFGMIVQNPQNGINTLYNLAASANGAPQNPPAAPILNTISLLPNSTNSYTVSWNPVPNASSYTLQQSSTSSFSSVTTAAQGNVLSYTTLNQPDGTYYYRVNATNSAGSSSFSNTQSITVATGPTLNAPILNSIPRLPIRFDKRGF